VDYRVRFTQRALNHFGEIIAYIAEDDSEAASRFGAALLDHIELLGRFPRMGEVIEGRPSVRRLVHSPILVYYRILDDAHRVEVLHIRHASRKPAKF
jgi:plasmid stabilization system protein ParE